ncbi:MAG: apolipoprotein N-acyltransferase [Alphaproteobacteria bacterium]|nr:apolipoprotein N-acyltransferase [Alphaproteobacteria bacterium]
MKVLVDVHDKRWNKYKINFEKIANAVVGKKYENSEVSVILTNDKEIQKINNKYRNINKPTNVLSFELGDDVLLGDIYISIDTVKKEAQIENIPVENHIAHMMVHGVLHLLGYDHINDDDAAEMEDKEIKILKKMGIKNPYQDDDEYFACCDADCCPGGGIVARLKKIKIKENGFWQYALYALFGGIAALGFAPFYQWWCTLIGIGGAYWLTVRNKNSCGFWKSILHVAPFGAVYALSMFWWVLNSIYVVPELTSKFAVWTIPALLGLMIAGVFIFSWPFVAISCIRRNYAYSAILFAVVWTLVLWGREWMFTGFPWNPIANISLGFPMLANSMSLWGALGLTFVLVGIVAAGVELLRNFKSIYAWVVFVVFVLMALFGCWWGQNNITQVNQDFNQNQKYVRIVQPAQSQEKKATHDRESALKNAEENLQQLFHMAIMGEKPDLIVFPETSYPYTVLENDFMPLAYMLETDIIIGASFYDGAELYNSMVFADKSGQIKKIYSKSHLVPFGEYSPLGILPSPVNLGAGSGPELIEFQDFVFAPAICYEIIFSGAVIPDDSKTPDAIINITNDNWFGNTPGTYQHLDMVRRYAIESGVPVIRANYSGISAFVLSDGNVLSQLPVAQSGVLDGFVWGAHNTPYRMLGMNFWMIVILVFSGLCLWGVSKKFNR